MSKKTKQNFKIGSVGISERKELNTEIMILKAENKILNDKNLEQELSIYKLKAELRRLDRSEKEQLEYRINLLECENEEMRERLKLIGDGADLLSICGLPMNLINKIQNNIGVISSQEKINNQLHQSLKQIKTPILIAKQEDK